jgi:hypothetical protein
VTPAPKLAAVERALVAAEGSVLVAARMLGIASAELRKLVRTHPLLADEAFEQIEQKIDAARQVLRDGLKSDCGRTRIRAAAYILRHTEAGRRRMLGLCGPSHDDLAEPELVTLRWIDT